MTGIGKRNHLLKLLTYECDRYGIDLLGADADPTPPAGAELGSSHILPRADRMDFPAAYMSLCKELAIDAAMTLIDPEIPVIAGLHEAGGLPGTRFLHPGHDVDLLCEDKYVFASTLADLGIPTVATSLEPLSGGPYIRKERRGSAASGFRYFEAAGDDLSDDSAGAEFVYQPFISGQHYCLDVYYSLTDGSLLDFAVKAVHAKGGGESYLLESVSRDRFCDLVAQVGEAIPMGGIVNFDVYDTPDGLVLMEINCRIGGNYPAAHAVGVNLLERMLNDAFDLGLSISEQHAYRPGRMVSKFIAFTEPYDLTDGSDGRRTDRQLRSGHEGMVP